MFCTPGSGFRHAAELPPPLAPPPPPPPPPPVGRGGRRAGRMQNPHHRQRPGHAQMGDAEVCGGGAKQHQHAGDERQGGKLPVRHQRREDHRVEPDLRGLELPARRGRRLPRQQLLHHAQLLPTAPLLAALRYGSDRGVGRRRAHQHDVGAGPGRQRAAEDRQRHLPSQNPQDEGKVQRHARVTPPSDADVRRGGGVVTVGRFPTRRRVYDFLGKFLTTGMRFLLNKQICPALQHASLVHVNSMLEGIPVRTDVDGYIGIDYSLTDDPLVTSRSLDMNFRGMFFHLRDEQDTLVNEATEPNIKEYERMIYLALSEFFFDSGLYAYYKAGIFQINVTNDNMPKDLEMLLRTTFFATIMMLNPTRMDAPVSLELSAKAPPKSTIKTSGATVAMTAIVKVLMTPAGLPPVLLSSMTMECKFNARVFIHGKRLAVQIDLRRFKMYSNQSALESLALIPLQAPLKTILQMSVVPHLNKWTKRGVGIPLADGMDLIEDVVEYHNGFIVIGANLHFSKGLREMAAAAD
ncbi:phospholipid transfer protein isoform X1 [Festucalex cinctus]